MRLTLLDEIQRLAADRTAAYQDVLQLVVEEYVARPPDPALPVEQLAEALLRRAYAWVEEASA